MKSPFYYPPLDAPESVQRAAREARIERRHQDRLRRLAWRDRVDVCPTCGQRRPQTVSGEHHE